MPSAVIRTVCALYIACTAAVGGLAAGPAAAQATTYMCRDAAGMGFSSRQPCPQHARSVAVVAPPAPAARSAGSWGSASSVYVPPPDEPAHMRYVGSRCRSLHGALRGRQPVAPDVADGMRREYERDCREEEQEAQQRWNREQRANHDERLGQRQQLAAQDQARRDDVQRRMEQCRESARILAVKKQRSDLSDGERAELRRFEDSFYARCKD